MLNDSIARVKSVGHVTVIKACHASCNEIHAYHITWTPGFPYIVDEDLSTFTLLGKCDCHVSITVVSFGKLRLGLMLLKKTCPLEFIDFYQYFFPLHLRGDSVLWKPVLSEDKCSVN